MIICNSRPQHCDIKLSLVDQTIVLKTLHYKYWSYLKIIEGNFTSQNAETILFSTAVRNQTIKSSLKHRGLNITKKSIQKTTE